MNDVQRCITFLLKNSNVTIFLFQTSVLVVCIDTMGILFMCEWNRLLYSVALASGKDGKNVLIKIFSTYKASYQPRQY